MSAKKYKVNRGAKKLEPNATTIKAEELYQLYQEKIVPYKFNDLVLIVLGGEFGVIAKYMKENIPFSKLFVIEPNKTFYNKQDVKEFYQQMEKDTEKKIEYIPIHIIEKNPQVLLDKMIKSDFNQKGIEIIKNPFYIEKFEKQINAEEERLQNYLSTIRPKTKKIRPEIIGNLQKKYGADEKKIKEILGIEKGQQIKELFNNETDTGNGSLVILIGFEQGFYAKHLLEKNQIHNLINIEVVEEYEKDKVSNSVSIESAFQTKDAIKTFYFTKGEEEWLNFFEFSKSKLPFIQSNKIIINPLYEKNHMEAVKKYLKVVTKHMKSIAFLKGNSISDEFYGMMNAFYNLRKMDEMKILKSDVQFDTVISVAGGPSLDDHIDYLKQIQNKYPIIAVEVIANKLIKNGIIPDIVTSQERVYAISKVTENFDAKVKRESVFAAPNFLHTFNFNNVDNFIIASQVDKSPMERYIYKTYYNFSHQMGQSIYVGEVNLNVAMWLKPKRVLLFGHDLAITPEKIYANESEGAANYSMGNSTKELGNRGQEVYITPIFHKYRNNTETILPKMIKRYGVKFISFSDGAKVNYVENALEKDYPGIVDSNSKKIPFKDLITYAHPDKAKIMATIQNELSILKKQLDFFETCESHSKFTIIARFIDLVVQKETLLKNVGRLIIDEFMGKHTYDQTGMEKWVLKNKNSFITLIKRVIAVIEKTILAIDNPEVFPNNDSDFRTLFDYNFFAPIRDRVYEIKEGISISMEDKLQKELTVEDLKYATLAFLYSFEPFNFLKMGEVVAALGKYETEDEQASIIYHEGLERLIAFYQRQWDEFKDIEETFFYRYQLASMHYAAGHLKWVIDFLSKFTDIQDPEQIILADAYSDIGEFKKAFTVYKEILKNSQSLRVIVNAYHCLIVAEKVGEACLFNNLLKKYAQENESYQNNLELMEKQIEEMTNWETENGLKENYKLIKTKEKEQRVFVIDFTSQEFEGVDDLDQIIDLFAKENLLKVYKLENRVYQYMISDDSKIPEFGFFTNLPQIKEL